MQCQASEGCYLNDGHSRVCRDGNGDMIPQSSRYYTPQAETFRSSPMREIRGSIETEYGEGVQSELIELLEAAERLEPYLTYYLWNEKAHELRKSGNPAVFFSACLANHGLEVFSE